VKDAGRASLDLKSSVCTDNPTGSDTYPFSSDTAQIVANTGMERAGGVLPIYEQETTFSTAGTSTMIAKDGTLVQVDSSHIVRLDDMPIGNVGTLAITMRGKLPSYLDAAWTADNTIIGITRRNTVITVYEYDPSTKTVLHSRNITFAGMPSGPIVEISIVRYVDMHYVDNQEFIVFKAFISNTDYILRESGTSATLIPNAAPNFAWRFAVNKYLIGNQGIGWYVGDPTGAVTSIRGVWAIIDRFPGTAFSRAILTFDVLKDGTNLLTGIGEVGYNSGGVYSATPTYYGIALGAATPTVTNTVKGPGYSSAAFTRSDTGTNIYYYMAQIPSHAPGAYYQSQQSSSATSINGYGKLTDIYNNAGNLVAWRVMLINGAPTMLSAAAVSAANDCMGVPMTNVGEFDESYLPHVMDDGSTKSAILYRHNGQLFYIYISAGTNTLSKVSDNVYLINCLSPINAIDLNKRSLVTGVTDYNGRMIWCGTTILASAKSVATIHTSIVNSIDPGDYITTNNGAAGTLLENAVLIPGMELPSFVESISDFGIDVFSNDVYRSTIFSSPSATNPILNAVLSKADLSGLTYVPDTRIPFAMGYSFTGSTMLTEIESIFTGVGVTGSGDIDYDYLCYEIGNDISGLFIGFTLFSQNYIFDGKNIWLATFNGSLFSGRGNAPAAPAVGMQLIASTPTEVFFISTFDNGLYSFNGGRSLTKVKRMNDLRNTSNQLETIINGVYNVRDNTLLLQTATTFVWVRDGVVTQNFKKAAQSASLVNLFDTVNGIQISNNTTKWVYSFTALVNSTVVPFTWQSAYHSLKANELSVTTNWIITFYCPEKITAPVTLTCYAFDQENYTVQKGSKTILPSWWDGLGFCRLRIQPKNEKALASSVQIDYSVHMTVTDVTAIYGDEAQAPIASIRSV
jgi:hypothetical protein